MIENPPPARFSVRVVGVSFIDAYPDNLHRLSAAHRSRFDVTLRRRSEAVGEALWAGFGPCEMEPLPVILQRNPDNEFDSNAVEVVVPTIGMIGHLPAYMAARVAPWLDAGGRMRAGVGSVLYTPDAPELPGVSLVLETLPA